MCSCVTLRNCRYSFYDLYLRAESIFFHFSGPGPALIILVRPHHARFIRPLSCIYIHITTATATATCRAFILSDPCTRNFVFTFSSIFIQVSYRTANPIVSCSLNKVSLAKTKLVCSKGQNQQQVNFARFAQKFKRKT